MQSFASIILNIQLLNYSFNYFNNFNYSITSITSITCKRAVKILQQRVLGVLFAEDCLVGWDAPIDAKGFVEDGDSAVRLWSVKIVTFVLEHCRLAQHCETVRKSVRDKELTVIVFREFHGDVLSVCWAALADVNCNIQNRALDAPNEFCLRERRTLKMQTPHHAIRRHRLVVLHKIDLADLRLKVPLRKRLKEISACILEHLRLNNHHAVYCCLDYFHNFDL